MIDHDSNTKRQRTSPEKTRRHTITRGQVHSRVHSAPQHAQTRRSATISAHHAARNSTRATFELRRLGARVQHKKTKPRRADASTARKLAPRMHDKFETSTASHSAPRSARTTTDNKSYIQRDPAHSKPNAAQPVTKPNNDDSNTFK
jgi:hypothetical protein